MAVAAVKRTFEELNTYFSPSPPVVCKKPRYSHSTSISKPIKNQHDEALPLKSNSKKNTVDWTRDLLLKTLTAVGSMDEAQVCTNTVLEGFERTITVPLHNQISLLEKQAERMTQELERKNQELEGKIYELEQKNQKLERKNWELEHIIQENTLLKRAVHSGKLQLPSLYFLRDSTNFTM
ncbi:hypothetical protein CMV_021810 [Castanea mollissima]|uniref:Uncharacterized protein n=1 Tax=Castanea mollissima TaxID=60419 RepID=A0A8J4QVQ1_9ROSI|nr:hypothetical protein CMV_021810 [Castanea mollissima]